VSDGIDISNKPSPHSRGSRAKRVLWNLVQATVFRWIPRPLHSWRARILRMFGARVSLKARVCPRAKIWGPWNLIMHDYATLADDVDCYCVATIEIGEHTTVSQYTYLCGASHDHEHPNFLLEPRPIRIGKSCWIAADVFVAPGVTIGDGTVVGARSSVFGDLPEWKVCVGTPARPIGERKIREPDA
jgi:putative colanic acid biosynthesis acetyltransferase WcaF